MQGARKRRARRIVRYSAARSDRATQQSGFFSSLLAPFGRAPRSALLFRQQLLPGVHAARDLGFEAFLGRLVEAAPGQLVGQVSLIGDAAFLVVRVAVAGAVAEVLHERVGALRMTSGGGRLPLSSTSAVAFPKPR